MGTSTDIPPIDTEGLRLRGRKGWEATYGDPDRAAALGTELRVHRLRQHAKAVVESFPPPTREQLDTVVALLNLAGAQ